MATILFDKMVAARKLEGEGLFTRRQAETLAEVYHDALTESAATKSDVLSLKGDMAALKSRMDAKISTIRTEIVLWVFGLLTVSGVAQHFLK